MTELFTIQGKVENLGVYTLTSDIAFVSVNHIRIPKGLKIKVWCKRVAGAMPTTLEIQYTHDITLPEPVWKTLTVEKREACLGFELEKRKPIILRGFTGKEAIRVVRTEGPATSWVDLELELGKEE